MSWFNNKNKKSFSNSFGGKISILFFSLILFASFAFAEHTSTAELQPEWSSASTNIDYTVTFCKETGDTVNEVRIYKNFDGSIYYTDFECDDKLGWEKLYISTYPACFYIADSNSPNYDPLNVDDECQDFTFSATTPPAGPGYCDLWWQFETRDVNRQWQFLYDKTSVDDVDPSLIKLIEGPQEGPCPPGQGQECWITQSTTITVQVTELGDCGPSGLDYCEITYTIDGGASIEEVHVDFEDYTAYWEYTMSFGEDSVHVLTVECKDIAGNFLTDEEIFRVDDTPPETTKVISEPKKVIPGDDPNEFIEWVDTTTTVTLTSVDPDPTKFGCNIGVKEIYWANNIVDEKACWDPYNNCNPVATDYKKVEGDEVIIQKENESCHLLQYYAVDELGNKEEVQTNCFFVDKTPPALDKDNGDAILAEGEPAFTTDANPNGEFHWLTTKMPVTFSCDDSWKGDAPHPSGDEELCYKVSFDYPEWGYITKDYCDTELNKDGFCCVSATVKDPFKFYFKEESMHNLEYYCIDAVEKRTDTHTQYYKVDDTPPSITKTMIGTDHLGECPPIGPDDECYVSDNGQNGVHVDVVDGGDICAVNNVYCEYELWWEDQPQAPVAFGNFGEEGVNIYFTEDSMHTLYINCEDDLGNEMLEDIEVFYVDSTPPVTTKEYGEPYKVDPECFSMCDGDLECAHAMCTWWITSDSEVTLTAEDEKVGTEEIYWRNLYFPENDEICHVSTGEFACLNGGDGCPPTFCNPDYYSQFVGEWPGWNAYSETGPFTKEPESCHVIEYYSIDKLGNEEPLNWQCVFVDNTAPIGIKKIGEPKLTCNLPIIKTAGVPGTTIEFSSEERVGEEFVYEQLSVIKANGVCDLATQPTQCAYVPSNTLPPFAQDTLIAQGVDPNALTTSCGDILILSSGNPLEQSSDLTTSMGNPGCGTNPDGYDTYDCVDLAFTPTGDSIVLAASAEFPHYYNSSFTDWMRIGGVVDVSIRDWETSPTPPYTNTVMISYGPTTEGTGTVTLATIGEGKQVELRTADSGDSVLDTILLVVPLSCFEDGPEPILCGNGIVEPGEECDDGNQEDGDDCSAQCLIEGEPGEPDCWWVRDHVTTVTVECEDQGPHPVEQETACFRMSFDDPATPWLTEQYCIDAEGTMEQDWCCIYVGDEPYEFVFTEDSVHDFEFYCRDHLGNTEVGTDYEIFKVDSVAPTTIKKYLGPFYEDGKGVHWIDTESTVELTATDGGEICHVDGITTYYAYALVDDIACWESEACNPVETQMMEYEGAFGIPQESCHVIQYYSVDALGNEEKLNHQCVFVDKKAPVITKEYEGPVYVGIPVNEEFQTIGNGTAEWSNIENYSEPYSARLYVPNGTVDIAAVEFNVDIALEDITELAFWQKITNTYGVNVILGIDADGDGVYEAKDKAWHFSHSPADLGDDSFIEMDGMNPSTGIWEEVDTTGISQWWTPNNAGDSFCAEFGWNYLSDIQSAQKCRIEPTDRVKVIRLLIGGSGTWMDKVAYVDDITLNGITNTLSGPEWINSETNILASAFDPEPHPSGVALIEYRVSLVDDSACWNQDVCSETEGTGDWTAYETLFNIADQSCHLIEIKATDNVGKTALHKQCVFVDNTPPNPVKEVGEPKEPWNGMDAVYYDLEEFCATPNNCWKVTLLTPIELECVDPTPHPVNHNTVCFYVELDADNATENYCSNYGGEINEENGFCCMDHTLEEFYFTEETEHNLKYYCEDALGNIGPVDDEKFKVEGTAFEIQLNKKWNLVSVPFVLINDSIESAFDDVKENVESVWTYDAFTETWYVYHPNGEAPSNLDFFTPGWGYWIRMYEEDTLLLGGSLFSPQTTPPSRNLKEGWNLIGYYGTEGQPGYYGPFGNGKQAGYALFSLGDSFLDKGWTSLISYWEPFNTDGDPNTPLWPEFGYYDYMDPGAGYWISATEDNKYEYVTNYGGLII